MSNLEEITAAVQALAELYQPIFGYELQGAKPIRNCEDRLADVKKIYDPLSAELGRPLRVLDLGCAQGYFSLHAAKWGGVVTGLDFDKANIDLCRLLARDNPEFKVNFVQATIENFLPTVKADEYDLVLCFSVLHWCVKFSGFEKVQSLLADLAQKVDTGIFEFAFASDFPGNNLPTNYREFLIGYPFIRALSYNIWNDKMDFKRPLCFASTKYAYFENLGLLKIDEVLASPYNMRTTNYFCGDKFVKLFNMNTQVERDRVQRDLNFLDTFGGQRGLPRLYISLTEQDEAGIRVFIVRDAIKGKTLLEKIANGENFDRWDTIRQILEWLVFFEQYGYYHGDVSTSNFIYGDDGKVYPIDYESMRTTTQLFLWAYSVRLQFLYFMNSLLEPRTPEELSFPGIPCFYPNPRYLIDLKKHVTPRQYERIARIREDEKFFARLYEILFEPEKDSEAYTVAETEILAVERYISYIGEKLKIHEERLEQAEKFLAVIEAQQRRIEALEQIVRERLK